MSINGSPASYAAMPANALVALVAQPANNNTRRNMNKRIMGQPPKFGNNIVPVAAPAAVRVPLTARARTLKQTQADRMRILLRNLIDTFKALKRTRDALPVGDERRAPLNQQMINVREEAASFNQRRQALLAELASVQAGGKRRNKTRKSRI